MDSLPSNNQDIVQSLDTISRILGQPVTSFFKYLDNGTPTRQSVAAGATSAVTGINISYTAPNYPVLLFVFSHALIQCAGNVARYGVTSGGSLFGAYTYHAYSAFGTHFSYGLVTVAANTTVTLGAQLNANGVVADICNANTDPSQRYSAYGYLVFRTGNV